MIIRTECKVDTVSYTVAYSPIDHVQVGKYAHELYIAIIYLFNQFYLTTVVRQII